MDPKHCTVLASCPSTPTINQSTTSRILLIFSLLKYANLQIMCKQNRISDVRQHWYFPLTFLYRCFMQLQYFAGQLVSQSWGCKCSSVSPTTESYSNTLTPRRPKHISLILAQTFYPGGIQGTGAVHFYICVDIIVKERRDPVHTVQNIP